MRKQFFTLSACLMLVLQLPAAENIFSREVTPQRALIVVASDPAATVAFQAQTEKVRSLVNQGLLHLTRKTNVALAWQNLVATNEIIGIKVHSAPGANSGTRSSVVAAVIEGLLDAGIPPKKIIIWDKHMSDLRLAGYVELAGRYNVRIAASSTAGYDEDNFYESPLIGNLIWGDLEFGKKGSAVGRKSFVTKLVTKDITKIISIVPLLNHNLTGTAGNLAGLALDSVDNTQRFSQAERLATAVPEIYALESLGDKVVLNITDALICQYQGEQRSLLHYSAALNEIWFSKDPVALDVRAINELNRQREIAGIQKNKKGEAIAEIYENASLLELGTSNLKNIQIEKAQ